MAIAPETVERYQIEFQKNPNSRIFAALAEAYRQMGLLDEAYQMCKTGLEKHPGFAGGRVAMARILIARKEPEEALSHLEKAAEVSPDNILAHSLRGDTLLQLRRPKDALKAFKTVLFLNPGDERAQRAVRKWEFLSAEDYDDELFEMKPLFQKGAVVEEAPELKPIADEAPTDSLAGPLWRKSEIERGVSLADAFTVRGELERAIDVLHRVIDSVGNDPEIDRRLNLLVKRAQAEERAARSSSSPPDFTQTTAAARAVRQKKLETFLQRINARRSS